MKNYVLRLNKETQYILSAVLILIIYLSPLYILGEDAHIRIHDNLDSNIAWYKVLARSGEIFGNVNAAIPQIINGLPRNAFDSQFSGIVWLYALFPTMTAYALSQTITRVFAFIGMYLLLKTYFVKEEELSFIRVGVSLAFALTPFWPSGMLSTLGMPLALWAFLNIRARRSTWKDWLVLTLLPLYSSFVLGFFFFLAAMGFFWLRDLFVKRKWQWRFLFSIAYMTALYLLIDYRLVYSLLIPQPPTNRNEFLESTNGFWDTIRLAFKNFLFGHTHVMTLHTYFILPVLCLVLCLIIKEKSWKQEKYFICLMALNFLLSVWYAFWFYKGWQPIKAKFPLLDTFNFSRFHFLHPLVIYLSFALACRFLWYRRKGWKKAAMIFLSLQLILLFCYNEEIRYRAAGYPSVKQFYSTHLFETIDHYIGKPKSSYRVASIGLHPAIAQYNGFYTIDTYNNFYPLSYKHQFRKVIAKELDKNRTLKDYFDHWGGRCYIFTAELGNNEMFKKGSAKKIYHLQLDMHAFKKLGGRYIFSAVPIVNAGQDGLQFMKSFTDSQSAWKIYLYKVK
ncbi:hypothetical protein JOD45_000333 [Scopulibacillus daqui]|uniref:YkoS n=1 Tax=Scopulibacillus daqui TaxID=1469162 RepID=A0ABS2PVR8_9BACL|nr:DUF6044 family protein [Scopulibacillus daqui]MBM7644142.1 hypothetical protein [Scopulibacillus daqui]